MVLLATDVMGLLVNSELPAKSVAEVIALAKSKPGALFYASPGNGTPQHMAMEFFKMETDTNIVHVPYKEQSGALTDLVAGRSNMMITAIFALRSIGAHVQGNGLSDIASRGVVRHVGSRRTSH